MAATGIDRFKLAEERREIGLRLDKMSLRERWQTTEGQKLENRYAEIIEAMGE